MVRDVVRAAQIGGGEGCFTIETLRGVGLAQGRIHSHPLIEYETFSIIMRASAFLEIFENPSIELEYFAETFPFHVRASFLAPDSASAKHNHRLIFHLLG